MAGIIWYNTNSIFEAINADWEAYPIGEGWESALENISWFAPETKFYKISDIDSAVLFFASSPRDPKTPNELEQEGKNPFSSRYYHIALWHSDLIDLHEKGYVSGIKPLTTYQYELLRFNRMTKALNITVDNEDIYHFPDGSKRKGVPKPTRYNCDNEFISWVDIPKGYIQLTPFGVSKINEPISSFEINSELLKRIEPLLYINYFDSAVREAAILLELKLKKINNNKKLFGQQLVDLHYENLIKKFNGTDSYLKYYRSLLRCSVNFIRNEYAHDFPITSENRAKRLITLYSKLVDLTIELLNEEN